MPQDRAMRAFVIHLGIFVLVVGLLAAINLYRNPDHLWFIWVLLGWGIGVAAHGLVILLKRTKRREAIFSDQRKRGFFVHLFVYVAVNALLIAINLLYSPGYYWFLIPLIGWGLLLLAHAYVTFYRGRQRSIVQCSNRS
jgi:predicted membrane channel-forming protein YqfA (hemolysin III family)